MIEISVVLFGILVGLAAGFTVIFMVTLVELVAAGLHNWRARRREVQP